MKEKLYRVLKKPPKERPHVYGEFHSITPALYLKKELQRRGEENIVIEECERPPEGEE